MRGHTRPS